MVRRGEILFAYDFLDLWWDIKMEDMNEKGKAESTDTLTPLFLLLATSEFIFIYHADTQTNRGNYKKQLQRTCQTTPPLPATHRLIEG